MKASEKFTPLHIEHSATLTVMASKATTLALFTPEGERAWVPDWNPEYLFSRDGGNGVDTAFRTTHGGEETLWMVLSHDLDDGSVGYARITPGSRMGTVMVDVEPIDATSCWVEVTYEMTALSQAGNAVLRASTPEAFGRMIADWERDIARHLGTAE